MNTDPAADPFPGIARRRSKPPGQGAGRMKTLQKLGKALMLPVSVMPICGLLMGLGYCLCPAAM